MVKLIKKKLICRCGCGNALNILISEYYPDHVVIGFNDNEDKGFLFGDKEWEEIKKLVKKSLRS